MDTPSCSCTEAVLNIEAAERDQAMRENSLLVFWSMRLPCCSGLETHTELHSTNGEEDNMEKSNKNVRQHHREVLLAMHGVRTRCYHQRKGQGVECVLYNCPRPTHTICPYIFYTLSPHLI